MATNQASEFIHHLRRTMLLRDGAGLSDKQLLEDFINSRDEAAMEVLVRRHGPMVWGVCRRLLNHHDAEDAFQATFLVLIRKAASIASRDLLANWLYGVAHQTALKARATVAKRKERERQMTEMPEPAATEQVLWRDLEPLLDQELSRLPNKYRAVIILCDLEGKTRKEAARQLGVPEGTVASRMATGRAMLAKRMARHGLSVSGGALAAVLSEKVASAGVPTSVVSSTINAVTLFAAGQMAATGAISVKVAALTEGVLKTMLLNKLKITTGVLLFLVAALVGGAGLIHHTQAADPPKEAEKPGPKGEKTSLAGTWKAVLLEVNGKRRETDALLTKQPVMAIKWTFTGNKLQIRGEGKTIEAGYTVVPSRSPKKIDLTFHFQDADVEQPAIALGIYSLEGDTLKVCFILDPQVPTRPLKFDVKGVEGTTYYTFRREEKQPATPGDKDEKQDKKEEVPVAPQKQDSKSDNPKEGKRKEDATKNMLTLHALLEDVDANNNTITATDVTKTVRLWELETKPKLTPNENKEAWKLDAFLSSLTDEGKVRKRTNLANLPIANNAKITDNGKEIKVSDLKTGKVVTLHLTATPRSGLEVVRIEKYRLP